MLPSWPASGHCMVFFAMPNIPPTGREEERVYSIGTAREVLTGITNAMLLVCWRKGLLGC